MKIAVIYQYIYPQNFGGGEKRLYEVFSRFPSNVLVDWYVQYDGDYHSYKELDRFNIISFENEKKSNKRRSIFEIIRYCYSLLTKVDLSKYDIIHIGQMPFFHILTLLIKSQILSLFSKKTAVVSIDWWEYWGSYWTSKHGAIVGRVGAFVEILILKLSKYFIVISPKTQSDIANKTHGHLELIHNGVNLTQIMKSCPASEKYDVVIFGRIEEWKNPLMGVQVFERMLSKNPSLNMIIIGDGSYKERLEEYIYAHKLDGNIRMYGRASDEEIYSLLKSSKVMFLFSKQEGGGSITLFEANACGLPVATAYFENGIDEKLVSNTNGFFFKQHSLDHIADTIYEILDSEEKLEKLSSSSMDFVKDFDWGIISKQYYNFFERIIKGRA